MNIKKIERDKMRAYRASKRPPKPKATIIINNRPQPQPQPAQQPQAIKPRKQKPKAPQQLQRVPQIQVKDYAPLHNHLMQRHYLTIQLNIYKPVYKGSSQLLD